MGKRYTGPGEYIAICGNKNFTGHYIRHFIVPDDVGSTMKVEWYFQNKVDKSALLEAVYPAEIFNSYRYENYSSATIDVVDTYRGL